MDVVSSIEMFATDHAVSARGHTGVALMSHGDVAAIFELTEGERPELWLGDQS